MTSKQIVLYWREWGSLGKRCAAEGWTVPDRHELHVRALGRDKSMKLLTNREFDLVLGVFRTYSQAENLQSQVRQMRQPRTRLEHRIKIDQVKLLAVLLGQPREGAEFAGSVGAFPAWGSEPNFEAAFAEMAEVAAIHGSADLSQVSDEPRPRYFDRDGQPIGEEKSDLELVRDTLAQRINQLRNKRGGAKCGWSIHDLTVAAGLECRCAQCGRARKPAGAGVADLEPETVGNPY